MKQRPTRALGALFALLAAACGGSATKPTQAEPAASTSGSEGAQGEGDPLSVSGLRGTLSQDEVRNALEPRMPKLSRCVQKRAGEVEWVSGSMSLEFLVAVDGSVSSVYPSASTIGDRATERCVLEVAKATRFPAPHGGEAEFSWSFEVPLDSEVRPPVDWTSSEVSETLSANGAALASQCGAGTYHVTAYIDPDGKVVAAGAATNDQAAAQNLDCVAEAVTGWSFPSPGSYAAKAVFDLP